MVSPAASGILLKGFQGRVRHIPSLSHLDLAWVQSGTCGKNLPEEDELLVKATKRNDLDGAALTRSLYPRSSAGNTL